MVVLLFEDLIVFNPIASHKGQNLTNITCKRALINKTLLIYRYFL